VRERLSARGDTEHEQAVVRIVIIGVLLAYALVGPLPAPPPLWWVPTVPQMGFVVGALSLLHLAWIVADPAVRRIRRAAWSVLDHAGIILAMAVGGEPMALLYPLLLWVTLGHGFRYGRANLIGSALVSVALFVPLVTFHPYWQVKGAFAVGLVLGLVLIPAYCLRLLQHLHEARRRAEASSAAKSRFLATMSHELRTPLNAILGTADLLRRDAISTDQREMVRTIQTSGQNLLNMIEDILDLARIEAGAERVDVERFDVHRLLHDVRDMLAHQAGSKGLELQLRFAPNLVGEIEGPRRAANQILVNLVANAVKFTDRGTVRIEAALSDAARHAETLRLAVVDTGCGIPASAHARIFDRFSQGDETTTRRHGGSGLGLAIVKHLVEGAGGTIGLASTVGVGTRFDVTLPVRAVADPAPPPTTRIVVHGALSTHQRRVLDEVGLGWRSAPPTAGVVAADVVDLWCRGEVLDPPPARFGRELILWGDDADVPDALVALAGHAEAVELARAVRAAVVVAAPAEDEVEPRVHAAGRSLDVLVADDHDVNRRVIAQLLMRCGHRAEVVVDGDAALAAAARSSFDAVVLDLNMPGLSGFDVASRLVALPSRPRLVALTADATETTRDACLAAGFDAHLTKPVDGRRLSAALDAPDAAPPPPSPAPAHAEPAAGTVLDLARLRMLHQLGDAAFVGDVVESFIADGERLIEDLAEAAAAGDVRRFRDAAHALRSAATHLGATALFERCLAVKSIDPDELAAEAPAIRDELARAFDATATALRAESLSSPGGATGSAPDAPSCADPAARVRAPARPTAR
jgi:two-component system sensor histidine kinase RpfC